MTEFRKGPKSSFASLISFLVSFSVHLVVCIALAVFLVGAGSGQGKSLVLTLSNSDSLSDSELDSIEFETEQQSELVVPEPLDVQASLVDSTTDVQPLDSSTPEIMQASSSESADSARQAAAMGTSISDIVGGKGSATKNKATFFGAEAYGNKFVFVIDSSGSMRGPRWEALCYELERAISNLSSEQEFFVVSFDTEPHPMFGKLPSKDSFLQSDKKSVGRLRNWIRSVDLGRNTYPAAALSMAMQLEPDAIFLLSDGEIMDNTVNLLRAFNRKMVDGEYRALIPIHTVLLHSEIGYFTLQTIAEDNEGTFTPVPFRPGF